MTSSRKQLPFADASRILEPLRAAGKKIVQCHGTFDMIHPGHILHFEEAKALGDVLVVTVTAEKFVNKGPCRPYFNDQLRVKWLAALECVDYVIVAPFPAAVEAIECVRPDIYCKGKEYERPDTDVTGNIHDDLSTVARLGGRTCFVGSAVFSSTRILNRHFMTFPPLVEEFCRALASQYPPQKFREMTDSLAGLRVLIIGDIIFDRYSTVAVQGLTSKNRILSGRFLAEEIQGGGSLAVCRHVREFTSHVKIIGLVGREPWVDEELKRFVGPDEDEIVRAAGFTTIVKQRFVEPVVEGNELLKLFAVNYIDSGPPVGDVEREILARVAACIHECDLVMVMDFGHGFMGDSIREFVRHKAPFLALNCQTNSNNHGFNIINRRYDRADSFSLDQTEIRLACGRRQIDFETELEGLRSFLGARYGWLTRGGIETIGRRPNEATCLCPPLDVNVVDTVGAGDAFFSVASLAAAAGMPLAPATFMGQLAGAQAVRIVGNSEPIRKARFLKSGEAMLSY